MPVLARTQNQMPVVGHQDVGEQLDRILRQSLVNDPLKRFEVGFIVGQHLSLIAAIEGQIDLAGTIARGLRGTRTPRSEESFAAVYQAGKTPVTFFHVSPMP
ncbi:MAG: hypothetical protein AAF802_11705 [Planctomycetota bacterium]